MDEDHALNSSGASNAKAADGCQNNDQPPLYGHSRSGEPILVEIVSIHEGTTDIPEKSIDLESNTNTTNAVVDRQTVRTELQNIAKDFPSCAKYLMKELDKRRLLTETRHTVSEEWIRHIVSKVASRTRSPDMRLMALYIREKLGGVGEDSGSLTGPPRAVSMDLPLLESVDKAASDRLKKCTCKMSTSMHCTCEKGAMSGQSRAQDVRLRRVQAGGNVHSGVSSSLSKHNSKSLSPPTRHNSKSLSPPKKGGISPPTTADFRSEFQDCSRWKMATIRRRIGNITVDLKALVHAVEDLGGIRCVDGKQGSKGKGWRAVAQKMGIDVERNRDAGYQIKKIYWLRQKQIETLSRDVDNGEWSGNEISPEKRGRSEYDQHELSSHHIQTKLSMGQPIVT